MLQNTMLPGSSIADEADMKPTNPRLSAVDCAIAQLQVILCPVLIARSVTRESREGLSSARTLHKEWSLLAAYVNRLGNIHCITTTQPLTLPVPRREMTELSAVFPSISAVVLQSLPMFLPARVTRQPPSRKLWCWRHTWQSPLRVTT
jgi:hypothetical protein